MVVCTFAIFKTIGYGIRQSSILSPYLFAIFLDDIMNCLSFGQKPLLIDDIILVEAFG